LQVFHNPVIQLLDHLHVVQVFSHLPIGLLELDRGTDEGRQFIYGQAHVRGGEPDRGGKN
jgi:hypothetical protein